MEGRTCDPYTPAQSKHTFSILFFVKNSHQMTSKSSPKSTQIRHKAMPGPLILLKWCPEASQKRLRKTLPKKHHKNRKNTKNGPFWGTPETRNEQGTNGLLVTFVAPGAPGAPLGAKMSPRPPPRAPESPQTNDFWSIFGCVVDVFWWLFMIF